jgi:hypothetical protein
MAEGSEDPICPANPESTREREMFPGSGFKQAFRGSSAVQAIPRKRGRVFKHNNPEVKRSPGIPFFKGPEGSQHWFCFYVPRCQ